MGLLEGASVERTDGRTRSSTTLVYMYVHRRGMRQARAQRGGARRGRGGHTERALQPPTQAAAAALTAMHYPPLVAAVRAGASGADATTTPGDAPGGDAAATSACAGRRG